MSKGQICVEDRLIKRNYDRRMCEMLWPGDVLIRDPRT